MSDVSCKCIVAPSIAVVRAWLDKKITLDSNAIEVISLNKALMSALFREITSIALESKVIFLSNHALTTAMLGATMHLQLTSDTSAFQDHYIYSTNIIPAVHSTEYLFLIMDLP